MIIDIDIDSVNNDHFVKIYRSVLSDELTIVEQ